MTPRDLLEVTLRATGLWWIGWLSAHADIVIVWAGGGWTFYTPYYVEGPSLRPVIGLHWTRDGLLALALPLIPALGATFAAPWLAGRRPTTAGTTAPERIDFLRAAIVISGITLGVQLLRRFAAWWPGLSNSFSDDWIARNGSIVPPPREMVLLPTSLAITGGLLVVAAIMVLRSDAIARRLDRIR